jgi:hypothetical protein
VDCAVEIAKKGSLDGENCFTTIPFASNIILELWKNVNGKYYVKLTYNDKSLSPCKNGDLTCDVEDFVEILDRSILSRAEYLSASGRVPSTDEYPDD